MMVFFSVLNILPPALMHTLCMQLKLMGKIRLIGYQVYIYGKCHKILNDFTSLDKNLGLFPSAQGQKHLQMPSEVPF